MRRLASLLRRNDPTATINPTALVNEAWIKLAHSPNLQVTSRLHFKRIAARAMRQVLIEAARRRHSRKRGGGEPLSCVYVEEWSRHPECEEHLLQLDEALSELERLEPRQAALVESRFFAGLDVTETASLLEVSEATVNRDWRAAKAWLKCRLKQTMQ